MKRLLLTFFLSVATLILFSQTVKTRLADPNTSWNNPTAWSPSGNPLAGDHIIVPAGVELDIDLFVTMGYLEIQSGAIVNIENSIVLEDPSTIENGSEVNWSSGSITGASSLTNNGELNLISNSNKSVQGGLNLVNNSQLTITAAGDLFINNAVVQNEINGVIDLQADGGNISWSSGSSHVLVNDGTIKKTTSTGEAQIYTELTNSGLISVESGTLSFQSSLAKALEGGTYDVFEGATFDWDGAVIASGNLSGQVDGNLNWNDALTVPISATLDFSIGGSVNWVSNNLLGGGVLTNMSTLNMIGNSNKSILGDTQFNNQGLLNVKDAGDLFISQGIVNNLPTGVIDLQTAGGNISWAGGDSHILNNSGVIKRTTGEGEAQIIVELINNGGIISVETGTLSFQNSIGKHFNGGVCNVSSGAIFDWDGLVSLEGEIVGTIDGTLNWNNLVNISDNEVATLDLVGNGNVNWTNSILGGGGTLVNEGVLNLTSNTNKVISDDTQLDNNGTINITSAGDLFISQGVLNNLESAVIDLQADGGNLSWSGGTSHILNNSGEIKKTNSSGEAQIVVELYTTPTSIISVENGTLSFQNTIGKYLTSGQYNVSEGATFDWDGLVLPTGTLTGEINGVLNWNNNVSIPLDSEATFAFSGAGDFNWTGSILTGGGTLINQSTLNLVGNSPKSILAASQLENEGIISILSGGDLYISDGVVTNTTSGTIDIRADGGNITWSGGVSHVLNNSGLIRKSTSLGEAQIVVELYNDADGIISVESGTLSFQNSIGKNLNGGTINVSSDAVFDWDGTILPSGTLTGNIEGTLNWNNLVTIPEDIEATFSFSGLGDFNWNSSSLNGGGMLTNTGVLNLNSNGSKSILQDTELRNQGRINIASNGDLFISQGIVTNEVDAIFDVQTSGGLLTYSGGTSHVFINEGLLLKSAGTGISTNYVDLTNEGVVEIVEGTFRIIGTYNGSGVISGTGTLDLPLGQVFSGEVSPGQSEGANPGTLTYANDYLSSAGASLQIDLNGMIPDSQHDVFHINGDAELNGGLDVSLGFIPAIGNEFVVLTTTGEITTCNLPSSETILSGPNNFIFVITCENDNQVVLELIAIGGNGDYNMDGAITISDLSGFLAEFGSVGEGLIGDFNGDGSITAADLSSFLSVFGIVY